jgi:hypothetical protein
MLSVLFPDSFISCLSALLFSFGSDLLAFLVLITLYFLLEKLFGAKFVKRRKEKYICVT